MKLETTFDIGDKVWVQGGDNRIGFFPFCGTVGMIRAQLTDSPGRPGEDLFHNYMPQNERFEEYMLVETGVGSGSVYKLSEKVKRIFKTKEGCQKAINAKPQCQK